MHSDILANDSTISIKSLDTIYIHSFGMNRDSIIWVIASNISNATNIKIDNTIINSKVNLKKNSISAKLPESFNQNKKVDISLVDLVSYTYSETKNGLLNVDEIYLLKLDDKVDPKNEIKPVFNFSDIEIPDYTEQIRLTNFGMNKSKTIWVKADNLTGNSIILLDTSLLTTKTYLRDNSLTAELPETFINNKKVSIQIVDPELELKSNALDGLLNVEEVYLLNLSKK